MQIEAYFQQLRETIDSCSIVRSFNVTYDKRGSHEGFIRGEVYFVDGSVLYLREFVDVEIGVDRLIYVYQYMDPAKKLLFRYDNTGHPKNLNLPTYPYHKHEGSEYYVVASPAPDLAAVLREIAFDEVISRVTFTHRQEPLNEVPPLLQERLHQQTP